MLELLQARERIGVPELARRLEVGERTVRRYAAMLREMGILVEAELGRYGAYSLRSGYGLLPMMFTDEEALGLALGLLAARHVGPAGVAPAVEGALARLERVMPLAAPPMTMFLKLSQRILSSKMTPRGPPEVPKAFNPTSALPQMKLSETVPPLAALEV
jgi:predicted DNA-binding transcriptional regulator YafY